MSPTRAPTSACSISSTRRPRAELDDRVGLRLAVRAREIDDERVALARRAVVGGHELGDRAAERVELLLDELLGHLRLGARHLERRPVDDLGCRLHLDRGAERPGLALARGQLEVVLRRRHRAQPRRRRSAPEPAADVRLDRLGPDAVACRRSRASTWRGTLPLRNPGILTDPARSSAACSTACSSSCGETSTVRRTRLSPSSSTWAMSGFKQLPLDSPVTTDAGGGSRTLMLSRAPAPKAGVSAVPPHPRGERWVPGFRPGICTPRAYRPSRSPSPMRTATPNTTIRTAMVGRKDRPGKTGPCKGLTTARGFSQMYKSYG